MPERTSKERFESALVQPDPGNALYGLARSFRREGMSQLEMYRLYDEFRAKLEHDDSAQYNAVLDTMDCIVGWGNPSFWIFGQELDRSLYDNAFRKDEDKT